jgi:type II secretory pathway predicted ATPase ExeA/tetratricopeptide (TPR) repeat protein
MYSGHFGLVESPFRPLSNTSRPFRSRELLEALEHFQYARLNRESFFLMVGEVGAGKTTAIRAIVDSLAPDVPVAVLCYTRLGTRELLEEILRRFGLNSYGPSSKSQLQARIERLLSSAKEMPVLIIDEAHLLSDAALEELRLLSNLEHGDRPLLQICLVGQPELLERLRRHQHRPLRQRIAVRYVFGRLTANETREYIRHRLKSSGAPDPSVIFSDDAADVVHEMAEGLPREINIIASQAMLSAFIDNASSVNPRHVRTTKVDYGFEGVQIEPTEISKALRAEEEKSEAPGAMDEPSALIIPAEETSLLETEDSSWTRPALAVTVAAVGLLAVLAIAFQFYPSADSARQPIAAEAPPARAPVQSSPSLESPLSAAIAAAPAIASEPAPLDLPPATMRGLPEPEPEPPVEARREDAAPPEAAPPPLIPLEPVAPVDAAADHLERGTWLAQRGSLDEAIAAFREALALNPGYVDAFYNLGVSLLDKGQVAAAIEALDRATELSPNDGQAQRALGIALRQSGDLARAAVSLQRAVELLPDDVFAVWHLASVLREAGDLEKAIEAFRKAIALKPEDAGLQQELGFSLRAAGRLPEATVALQKSIDLDSNLALAHYTLGVTLLEMGERDAGEREIAEARRLGYQPR